jgi:hypothetical protein
VHGSKLQAAVGRELRTVVMTRYELVGAEKTPWKVFAGVAKPRQSAEQREKTSCHFSFKFRESIDYNIVFLRA